MKFSIKDKLTDFKLMIKKIFTKYPITLIIIYTVTLFTALLMNTDLFQEEWIEKLLMYCGIWVPGVFFAENLFEKGNKRFSLYILTGIISFLFVHFAFAYNNDQVVERWLSSYLLTLILGNLFLLLKKSGKDFSEYVLKVTINLSKTGLVYGILALGVALIFWVFSALIWKGASEYIENIEVLILGFFYSTIFINAFININEDVNKFFKNLIKYVLMPIIIITFAIIYLYIIKIFVLRDIPKNQIFRITTALFIFGGFIWTVMNYFKEEGAMYIISTKLPIIFSPFIFLQIYVLGIRISKNGITPTRYAGIVFIVFEICYIICYIFKNKKIKNMIILANVLLIISILVPKINAFDVSDYSQIKNLKVFSQKAELTDEDKTMISGAYYYLEDTKYGKEYIKNNLSNEQKEKIKELKSSKYNNYRNAANYIRLENDNKVNVEGYNYLFKINASDYNDENIDNAFSKVTFKNNSNKVETVDISNKMKEYINIYEQKKEKALQDYFKENNEIYINQNKKIIIEFLSMSYNDLDKMVESYTINAYLLER